MKIPAIDVKLMLDGREIKSYWTIDHADITKPTPPIAREPTPEEMYPHTPEPDRSYYIAEDRRYARWISFPISRTKSQRLFVERTFDKLFVWAYSRCYDLKLGGVRIWTFPRVEWIKGSTSYAHHDGVIELGEGSLLLTALHEFAHYLDFQIYGSSNHDDRFAMLLSMLTSKLDRMPGFWDEVATLY